MHAESIELAYHVGLVPPDEHARVMGFINQKNKELKRASGDERFRIEGVIHDEVLQVLSKYMPMPEPKTIVEYRDIITNTITTQSEALQQNDRQAEQEIVELKANLVALSQQLGTARGAHRDAGADIERLMRLVDDLEAGHLRELNAYNRSLHNALGRGGVYVDIASVADCRRMNDRLVMDARQQRVMHDRLVQQIADLNTDQLLSLNTYNRELHNALGLGIYVEYADLVGCRRAYDALIVEAARQHADHATLTADVARLMPLTAQLAVVQTQLAVRDQRIADLRAEIQRLEAQNERDGDDNQIAIKQLTAERTVLQKHADKLTELSKQPIPIDLQPRIHELETELTQVRARMVELEHQSKVELDGARARIATLETELTQARARDEEQRLKAELAQAHAQLASTESQAKADLDAARARSSDLEQQRDKCKQEMADLKKQLADLNAKLVQATSDYHSELDALRAEYEKQLPPESPDVSGLAAKYEKQITELQAHAEDQLHMMQNLVTQNEQQQQTIVDQNDTIDSLKAAAHTNQQKLETLSRKISELTTALDTQKDTHSAAMQETTRLNAEISKLVAARKVDMYAHREELKQKDAKITQLNETIAGLKSQIDGIERDKRKIDAKRAKLQDSYHQLQTQLVRERDEYEQKLTLEHSKNASVRAELSAVRRENEALIRRVHDLEENAQHQHDVHRDMAALGVRALEDHRALEQENADLRRTNQTLTSRYNELKAQYDNIRYNIGVIKKQYDSLVATYYNNTAYGNATMAGQITRKIAYENVGNHLDTLNNLPKLGGGDKPVLTTTYARIGSVLLAIIVCIIVLLMLCLTWSLLTRVLKPSGMSQSYYLH
jgi:chromosome segregation ATPase